MGKLGSLGLVAGAVLVTAGVIYTTPLKHVTIVEPTVRDIDPSEFAEDFKRDPDSYIFLDVRPQSDYELFHAAGSLSMPLHSLYSERHALPKKGKTIVLICSGGSASGVGYSYLEHYGFQNLRRIEGGIENWVLEKLPLEGKETADVGQ